MSRDTALSRQTPIATLSAGGGGLGRDPAVPWCCGFARAPLDELLAQSSRLQLFCDHSQVGAVVDVRLEQYFARAFGVFSHARTETSRVRVVP